MPSPIQEESHIKINRPLTQAIQFLDNGNVCWMSMMRIQVRLINEVHNDAIGIALMVSTFVFAGGDRHDP